jgi:hypothetical protein
VDSSKDEDGSTESKVKEISKEKNSDDNKSDEINSDKSKND